MASSESSLGIVPSPANRVRRMISGAMPAHNPAMQHDSGLDGAKARVQRSGRHSSQSQRREGHDRIQKKIPDDGGSGRRNRRRAGDRPVAAGHHLALPDAVELGGADPALLRGLLRAGEGRVERPAGDPAVRRGRRHRRVRDPRRGHRRRPAGAVVVAGLLDRQGRRPRGHQRLRVRLPASVAGRGVVLPPRRPADAARRPTRSTTSTRSA